MLMPPPNQSIPTVGVPHESRAGLLVVISGPSGVGKTTIVGRLKDRIGAQYSVSATTRPRTVNEVDGTDYHFVDEAAFRGMIQRQELLEHAQVYGHYYGTPRAPVENALSAGKTILLDIDVQGGFQVRAGLPRAFLVFVLPPNDATLLARLRERRRDSEEAIQRRYQQAREEIAKARSSGAYDLFVVNADLAESIETIVTAVETRRRQDKCS